MFFKSFFLLHIFSNYLKSVPGILVEHRTFRVRDHHESGPGIVPHLISLVPRAIAAIPLAGDEQHFPVVHLGIYNEAVGQVPLLIEVLGPEHGGCRDVVVPAGCHEQRQERQKDRSDRSADSGPRQMYRSR